MHRQLRGHAVGRRVDARCSRAAAWPASSGASADLHARVRQVGLRARRGDLRLDGRALAHAAARLADAALGAALARSSATAPAPWPAPSPPAAASYAACALSSRSCGTALAALQLAGAREIELGLARVGLRAHERRARRRQLRVRPSRPPRSSRPAPPARWRARPWSRPRRRRPARRPPAPAPARDARSASACLTLRRVVGADRSRREVALLHELVLLTCTLTTCPATRVPTGTMSAVDLRVVGVLVAARSAADSRRCRRSTRRRRRPRIDERAALLRGRLRRRRRARRRAASGGARRAATGSRRGSVSLSIWSHLHVNVGLGRARRPDPGRLEEEQQRHHEQERDARQRGTCFSNVITIACRATMPPSARWAASLRRAGVVALGDEQLRASSPRRCIDLGPPGGDVRAEGRLGSAPGSASSASRRRRGRASRRSDAPAS